MNDHLQSIAAAPAGQGPASRLFAWLEGLGFGVIAENRYGREDIAIAQRLDGQGDELRAAERRYLLQARQLTTEPLVRGALTLALAAHDQHDQHEQLDAAEGERIVSSGRRHVRSASYGRRLVAWCERYLRQNAGQP